MADITESIKRLEEAVLLLIEVNEFAEISQIPLGLPDRFAEKASRLLKIADELKRSI